MRIKNVDGHSSSLVTHAQLSDESRANVFDACAAQQAEVDFAERSSPYPQAFADTVSAPDAAGHNFGAINSRNAAMNFRARAGNFEEAAFFGARAGKPADVFFAATLIRRPPFDLGGLPPLIDACTRSDRSNDRPGSAGLALCIGCMVGAVVLALCGAEAAASAVVVAAIGVGLLGYLVADMRQRASAKCPERPFLAVCGVPQALLIQRFEAQAPDARAPLAARLISCFPPLGEPAPTLTIRCALFDLCVELEEADQRGLCNLLQSACWWRNDAALLKFLDTAGVRVRRHVLDLFAAHPVELSTILKAAGSDLCGTVMRLWTLRHLSSEDMHISMAQLTMAFQDAAARADDSERVRANIHRLHQRVDDLDKKIDSIRCYSRCHHNSEFC